MPTPNLESKMGQIPVSLAAWPEQKALLSVNIDLSAYNFNIAIDGLPIPLLL